MEELLVLIGIVGLEEYWLHEDRVYVFNLQEKSVDELKSSKVPNLFFIENFEDFREEALARMPKRVEIECGFGLTEDFQFTITEESREKIYDTMNIDFCNSKFTVTVIIEEVQE